MWGGPDFSNSQRGGHPDFATLKGGHPYFADLQRGLPRF